MVLSTLPGYSSCGLSHTLHRIMGYVFMSRKVQHMDKSNEYLTNLDMKLSKVRLSLFNIKIFIWISHLQSNLSSEL